MAVAVRVRPAARGDVPAVLELWSRARSPDASTPDTAEAVARLLATAPDALLVAEAEASGEIVGALVAHEDARAIALWSAAGYAHDAAIGRSVRNL